MLIQAAVSFGTVIMFGSAGEILTEKSGNLNLGVPGMMYLGGIASLAGSFFYERACRLLCAVLLTQSNLVIDEKFTSEDEEKDDTRADLRNCGFVLL